METDRMLSYASTPSTASGTRPSQRSVPRLGVGVSSFEDGSKTREAEEAVETLTARQICSRRAWDEPCFARSEPGQLAPWTAAHATKIHQLPLLDHVHAHACTGADEMFVGRLAERS